jgi:hypothetical protein
MPTCLVYNEPTFVAKGFLPPLSGRGGLIFQGRQTTAPLNSSLSSLACASATSAREMRRAIRACIFLAFKSWKSAVKCF